MTQLDAARQAHADALAEVTAAEASYRELVARQAQAQMAAAAARQNRDADAMSDQAALVAALALLARDALAVADARRKTAADAERAVTDIETGARNLQRQREALAAELAAPRNRWQRDIWAAESDVQRALQGLAKAQQEHIDAVSRLAEFAARLVALAGE
jgi:hypothetical protein